MRDKIFYASCFGFLSGVLARSFLLVDFCFVALLALCAGAVFLFCALAGKHREILLGALFILAFASGVFRLHLADKPAPASFDAKVGKTEKFYGLIVDAPDIRENNQKLVIETRRREAKTKILVTTSPESDLQYGDQVNLLGKLEKPENFITDQGKEFDYVNYLRKDGILYVVDYPKIELVGRDGGNALKRALFFVKDKFLSKLHNIIQSPENLLMGGLVLGEKSSFPKELRENFISTGTIHIVALSGYNVMVVAEWLMKFFSFLPFYFGISAGTLAILFFILMTGASSTAIRAGIMATLALFARATGRSYDAARALLLALVLMVLFNPFVLVHDVSFELSFLATFAVIFFTPRVERHLLSLPRIFGLREIIAVTASVYIFVLPFILYKMGNLSLVALPANILILPFIPITMFFGFLTGFVGIFSHALAVPFGYVSYLFLHYELWVVDFFAKLPLSSFSIPEFPLFATFAIYAYFLYVLFRRR